MVYSYGQDEYLMMRMNPTPDVVDDNDDFYAVSIQIHCRRRDHDEDNPTKYVLYYCYLISYYILFITCHIRRQGRDG